VYGLHIFIVRNKFSWKNISKKGSAQFLPGARPPARLARWFPALLYLSHYFLLHAAAHGEIKGFFVSSACQKKSSWPFRPARADSFVKEIPQFRTLPSNHHETSNYALKWLKNKLLTIKPINKQMQVLKYYFKINLDSFCLLKDAN